jgi:hypothetical protein
MGPLKPKHPRRFAKSLLETSDALYEHAFMKALLHDVGTMNIDLLTSRGVQPRERYVIVVTGCALRVLKAMRRAGVSLVMEACEPYGHLYDSIGLDSDERQLYYRGVYIVQLVSIGDIALHLTNQVLRIGIDRRAVNWKSILSRLSCADRKSLASRLADIRGTACEVRDARHSHVHAGEEPPLDTEDVLRSARRLTRSLSREEASSDRISGKMKDWAWQQHQVGKIEPVLAALRSLLDELLPQYERTRDSF